MRVLIAATFWVAFLFPACAQHNHAAGHSEYQNWSSEKVASCCSNQDCRGVEDNEIRQTAAGAEILIDGQWCPVTRQHYLTRGKSPDWSVNHACIRAYGSGCERLLCFTPKGGF